MHVTAEDKNELPVERLLLSLALCGQRSAESWGSKQGEVDFFDLKGVIEKYFESINVTGAVFQPDPDPFFRAGMDASIMLDGNKIRQALLNLMLNGIQAMPDGGTLRVSAGFDAKELAITVSDEGPGVPEAERTRVFELFHSTRPGSHGGLGLAISHRIVEEAGGHIAIEDAPGGGALFRVWLPVAADE